MTKEQISFFREGYWEARRIAIGDVKRIAGLKKGHRQELLKLADELEADEKREHWDSIQEEFPGMTREQYKNELDRAAELIREKFYQKNGLIKLRLVKPIDER